MAHPCLHSCMFVTAMALPYLHCCMLVSEMALPWLHSCMLVSEMALPWLHSCILMSAMAHPCLHTTRKANISDEVHCVRYLIKANNLCRRTRLDVSIYNNIHYLMSYNISTVELYANSCQQLSIYKFTHIAIESTVQTFGNAFSWINEYTLFKIINREK